MHQYFECEESGYAEMLSFRLSEEVEKLKGIEEEKKG